MSLFEYLVFVWKVNYRHYLMDQCIVRTVGHQLVQLLPYLAEEHESNTSQYNQSVISSMIPRMLATSWPVHDENSILLW